MKKNPETKFRRLVKRAWNLKTPAEVDSMITWILERRAAMGWDKPTPKTA